MKTEITENKAHFEFRGIRCALSYIKEYGWRFQTGVNGSIDSFGAAQMLSLDTGETLCETESQLEISREYNRTVISAEGENIAVIEEGSVSFSKNGKPRKTITALKAGKQCTIIEIALDRDEQLYGTGERFDSVNRRGRKFRIYSEDRWCRTKGNSYIPIPFILSSDCTALFFNRFEHSVFDLGKTKKDRIIVKQFYAPVDLYIFRADSPSEILSRYADLTGHAPLPNEWCFGTLVCRYHPEFATKDGILNMCRAMDENGFPWDAVIAEGFRTYDTAKRDELKEISEYIHSLGKKLLVYEQCGRFPSNAKDFGLDDSHAVKGKNGTLLSETRSHNPIDNFHRKKMRCIDITDKNALKKWDTVWNELADGIGVDGVKTDFCEQFPDREYICFSDGRSPMDAHHRYPVLYNIIQHNRFSERPDGGLSFARGGGIGAQRYPFVWAGDQRREFFFLKAVIKAALSLGLSGVPFTAWDMGGYQPSFNPVDLFREKEVFLRALEFTVFSPCIQTHGRVKRPYDFDEKTKALYRAYSDIHECLKPYLVNQAEISCKTGIPLMRHLFLYDCRDTLCRNIDDEYMLGDAFLVAPILTGSAKRNIYLPKGNWINLFDKKDYEGNRMLKNFICPLEQIPVFVKKDAESSALKAALVGSEPYIENIIDLSK